MSAADRRQGWRILEFAARIAQEDETAALPLLSAAASAFRSGGESNWPNGSHEIEWSLSDLWNRLHKAIEAEKAAAKYVRNDGDPK